MDNKDEKTFDFEARLTKLEILMEQMIKKQDEFNTCYKDLPRDLIILQEENKNQQKEIDDINSKLKGMVGALASIAVGLVVALLKSILKI